MFGVVCRDFEVDLKFHPKYRAFSSNAWSPDGCYLLQQAGGELYFWGTGAPQNPCGSINFQDNDTVGSLVTQRALALASRVFGRQVDPFVVDL